MMIVVVHKFIQALINN